MDPQQELFTEILLKIKELGYDVYDAFYHRMRRHIPLFIWQMCIKLISQIKVRFWKCIPDNPCVVQ